MSFAEIETELTHLSPTQLRRLALKSWSAFVARERGPAGGHECNEGNPDLLTALDEALAHADATLGQGQAGHQVHARLSQWISK
jgi:hypothetical protein